MAILITFILILSILIIFSSKKAERFLYCHILLLLTKIKISEKHNNQNYSKFNPNPDLEVFCNLYFRTLLREHHYLQRYLSCASTFNLRKAQRLSEG